MQSFNMNGKIGLLNFHVQDAPNTDPLKQHTYFVEIDGIKVNAVVYQEQLDEIESSNG